MQNEFNAMEHVVGCIRTKEEADMVLEGIKNLQEALYQTDTTSLFDIIPTKFPKRIAQGLTDVIRQHYAKGDISSVNELFNKLSHSIQHLEVLRLHIAFEPTETGLNDITQWINDELGQGIIADIHVDRLILGGVRVVWRGRIWEKTLNQMIAQALDRQKETIIKDLIS